MKMDRQNLIEKRDELVARLDAINADYRRGLNADSEEQAAELANAEVLDGIARATAAELEQVEKQLAELDSE